MRKSLILTALSLSLLFFMPMVSMASSYDVTATVPFPAPSQSATIDSSLNNLTTDQSQLQLFGTCQYLSPLAIVSVWRNGGSIGSTNCQNNSTYSLTISLDIGQNTMIVRTSSITANYGPDSSSFTITYTPKTATPEPTPSVLDTSDAAPSTSQPASNSTTGSELKIETKNSFEIMSSSNTVSVEVTVSNGTSPYTITLNWGDGTMETRTVDKPGVYTFQHTYKAAGIYQALIKVTDVLGVVKEHQLLISSSQPQSQNSTNAEIPNSTDTGPNKSYKDTVLYTATGIVFIAIMVTSFWYGRHYELNVLSKKKHPVFTKPRTSKKR